MQYLTTLTAHNFLPSITLPTRITDHSATLIDHLFVRIPRKNIPIQIHGGAIFDDTTDHLPIFSIIENEKCTHSNKRPFIRIYSESNITMFKNKLKYIKWDNILNCDDVDLMTERFYSTLNKLHNESFPLVRQSRKRNRDKRWITAAIRTSITEKNRLYRLQLRRPTPYNISRYKAHKNILTTILRESELSYYHDLFSNTKDSVINF